MELLQLQYFQTVAKHEHMTRAAEELRIAQPALSKTIARLEEDLGVPLFDRQNRQIRLNAYGKAFLQKVETALTALEEGRREVADLAGGERGRIHLATSTLERLSKPLADFREQYPDVHFRITQVAPAAMEIMRRLLEKGEADLCFAPVSIQRDGIQELPVLRTEVCLAVPPGHWLEGRESIHLQEVAEESFIEYREGHPFRKTNDQFYREAGIQPTIVCEVEEPAALSSLVLAGLGVAFVPMCAKDNPPFHVLRIDGLVCERVFTVAFPEKRYLSLAARRFRDFLVGYFD
ncbi:LysR family transcriptional regulator [Brevibacillus sp. TJ4]|uniref:LysR family transcriptional regulator n=1 Tax=Brevibacillus sp. TJ4 TaxID=3234853 RepID=UPI0037D38DF2